MSEEQNIEEQSNDDNSQKPSSLKEEKRVNHVLLDAIEQGI